MDLFDKCRNFTLANEYREMGIYPYFHELETRQDVEVIMEGKRRIMLGSNNYLGLTINKEVTDAAKNAVEQYGSGCSGSRFLNGTLNLHVQLEKELAEFIGKEACVTFSTGFQSNLGIISAVTARHDYLILDKEDHASIYSAARLSYATMLRYEHSDMADLERVLQSLPLDSGKLIVTDGVFSMGGDICNLPKIVELAKKYNARTMVDDAHGLGVLGEHGRGTAEHFGLTDQVDIIMGTFSKSMASLGGYMVADEYVIEYVRHKSNPFIFCASITPASCASTLAALRVLKKHPELVRRLEEIGDYVRAGLTKRGVPIRHSDRTPIVPIYTKDFEKTLRVAKALYEAGVYVNPVLPPATPPDDCLLRTSYMASHTNALLDEAMDTIAKVLSDYGLLKEA
jgi:8-amino-7-oxononanoate synthase